MITVAIIDDDKAFLQRITTLITEVVSSSDYADFTYEFITVCDPEAAKACCVRDDITLALLDIDMPGAHGFDLAAMLGKHTKIIFVSGLDQMVYPSLKFCPFRFIRKSHLQDELPEAICAVLADVLTENHYITLGNRYFNQQIFVKEIVYIESRKNYAEIVTDKERFAYRSTIGELHKELAPYSFARVHAAFLINLRKVKFMHGDMVEMESGIQLKMSRKYKDDARKSYFRYLRQ